MKYAALEYQQRRDIIERLDKIIELLTPTVVHNEFHIHESMNGAELAQQVANRSRHGSV